MSWEQIILSKTDEVDTLLNERGIIDEDLKKVIFQANESGNKLYQDGNDRFLAKARLDKFTVYVEYTPRENEYQIHSGYSHRINLKSDLEA